MGWGTFEKTKTKKLLEKTLVTKVSVFFDATCKSPHKKRNV